MDSELDTLTELIASWPGLSSRPQRELVDDCLVLVDFLGDAHRLVDIGSGGGLPGLVLKIARPELHVTLIESSQRKAAFLVQASAQLNLTGVEVVRMRAEDAGRHGRLRESFDVAVVRALAEMSVLAELCLPLVRIGGRLLAMKVDAKDEVESAAGTIDRLGGRLVEIARAPSSARTQGEVVVLEKVETTPPRYPRRPGVPTRRPIGG